MKGLLKRAADWGNRTNFQRSRVAIPSESGAAAYREAFALHQAGRLSDAADAYGAIVASDGSHFDACHMLGVVRFQQGHYADAVSMLQRAVELNPSSGAAQANHGAALRAAGNPVAAESAFERAARLVPDWSLPVKNLGSIRLERGDADAAIAAFRRAAEIDPRDVDAFLLLGTSLSSIGDFEEAETVLRYAVACSPEVAPAHFYLGNVLRARGDEAGAEQCFREALSLEPRLAEANNNLGAILQRAGDLARAEGCFRAAIAARPAFNAARANLATTLRQLGRLDEAEGECRDVLRAFPADVDALNALALIHSERGDRESARRCLQLVVSSASPTAAAHVNLGTLLTRAGDAEGAERSYRAALALEPANPTAAYNLATLSLMHGRLEEGFRLYEARFDCFAGEMLDSAGLHRQLDRSRRWRGEPLNGRRVLVWTEQGLGDALMMMRYLPSLPALGAGRVVVQCQPPLARCMRTMACVTDVVVTAAPADSASYDVHVPIMSLPLLVGIERLHASVRPPYLDVPTRDVDEWSSRVGPRDRLRVGIAWAGSKVLRDDAKRSIPLTAFSRILAIEDVALFSLQKDDEASQAAQFAGTVRNLMEHCGDLLDTAALILQLDLVVTVDTVVAHLAGALNKPVWLLNRHGSEWRWGVQGENTPWYPSMRIFRQSEPGDWQMVLDAVAGRLRHLTSGGIAG